MLEGLEEELESLGYPSVWNSQLDTVHIKMIEKLDWIQNRRQEPYYKAYMKLYNKKYKLTESGKEARSAARKKYVKTAKGRESCRNIMRRWRAKQKEKLLNGNQKAEL